MNYNNENGKLKESSKKVDWINANGYFFKEEYVVPYNEEKGTNNLTYTEAEIHAIKVYEGVRPSVGPLARDANAYMTINAMMFPGIDNELERIFDDNTTLSTSSIYNIEELLRTSCDLYSAMYKYGKRMAKNKIGYKIARASTAKQIADEGRIISNFSTSQKGYSKGFKKDNISIIQAMIKAGTPCADFLEILGKDDYMYIKENEVLVAPMCIVKVLEERPPRGVIEKGVKSFRQQEPLMVYKLLILPPPKATPLTEKEYDDYSQKREIIYDELHREKAASFIAKLQFLKRNGFQKSNILYGMDEENSKSFHEDMESYLEWKNAFQDVYRYKVREIMLELDKEKVEQTDFKITMDDLYFMASTRDFSALNNVVSGIKGFIKDKLGKSFDKNNR